METPRTTPVDWKVTRTDFWEIRSALNPAGGSFVEFTSRIGVSEWPLIHMTFGRNPETGRLKTAKGIIALGRIAFGVFPVGQLAVGIFPVGQAAFGLVFAIGQAALAVTAVGQLAIAYHLAVGQLAVAKTAVGQMAFGKYCVAQVAVGEHIYTQKVKDPEALRRLREALPLLGRFTAG